MNRASELQRATLPAALIVTAWLSVIAAFLWLSDSHSLADHAPWMLAGWIAALALTLIVRNHQR